MTKNISITFKKEEESPMIKHISWFNVFINFICIMLVAAAVNWFWGTDMKEGFLLSYPFIIIFAYLIESESKKEQIINRLNLLSTHELAKGKIFEKYYGDKSNKNIDNS